MPATDFDLLVTGHETEGVLAAVAALRAGARVALAAPAGALLGGLLTEDGLAFVDRDSRHLIPPQDSPHDGLFGQFLARAGVPLVALEARRGHATLEEMLAGVTRLEGDATAVRLEAGRIVAVTVGGQEVTSRHVIDATPDLDLAELAGMRFATGFQEYGDARSLGISPLPLVYGVTPAMIMETCRALSADSALEALKQRVFGDRAFLELGAGDDYVLVGPPHLGLAYHRWRDAQGFPAGPYPFEADGFNVAVLGPAVTSWNGLIYFARDPQAALRLSREGADVFFREEAARFGRFLREGLGWRDARVELPRGVYVRQTRHALDVHHRLTLAELAAGYAEGSVGTFSYYADFRGFHSPHVPGPVTGHVILGAGLASAVRNLGLASRAGGYTPFAHSFCRLVQYNATLGTALGVAAAQAGEDLGVVPAAAIREELSRQGALAADPAGFERNPVVAAALRADPIISREG
ncbi:MAG: hypothetical protein JWM80_3186 [Cyanobacteria bacterium RYN_339]|nr:hypothetical protein [Cyanobacteria bacterium RYN_339]